MIRFRSFAAGPLFACGLVTCGLLACGGPPPVKPIEVAPTSSGTAAPPPSASGTSIAIASAGARRAPSMAVAKVFPFATRPAIFAYADFEGFFRTELLRGMVPVVLELSKDTLTDVQAQCFKDFVASAKEAAGGDDDDGTAGMVVRFDPALAKSPGKCVQTAKDAKPEKVAGADEAYAVGAGLVALKGNLLVAGSRPFVEGALAGRGGGALADTTLGPDEYLTWSLSVPKENVQAHGGLVASSERFRIDADIDLPREEIAREIEKQLAVSKLMPAMMGREAGMKADGLEALRRLVSAVDVKRDGKRIIAAFDLKEPPADQARDLGAAATLSVFAVRKYIVDAKTVEARNTLGAISREIITDFEREEPNGKKRSSKKLASYPAVPKVVPKGVKYQSKPEDWKPWSRLRFEMTSPQYFQYEVKAAKDGESCEVIAHGDLNGDGKSSTFKLTLKIDRPGDRIIVSPSIMETDPQE